MSAPLGNQYWQRRNKTGRERTYKSPAALWSACVEYFEHIEKTPLQASELIKFQGKAKLTKVPKTRAMTISGLCLWIGISRVTWYEYEKRKGFLNICSMVEEIIRTQKFEAAAADMLNPAIIARDLGLADKRQITSGLSVYIDKDDATCL